MPIVIINNNELAQSKDFQLKCLKCKSTNCEIELDWASYPSASWNNAKIICKNCHTENTIIES